MTPRPLVTIGVPVYNGEHCLRHALDSLLSQTYQQIEIIVCDNASTDGTPALCAEYVARDPRVRYVRNERNIGYRGPNGNFRRVLSHARTEYFMWASADDVRRPTVIAECVEALERNPEAVLAHGPIELTFQPKPGLVLGLKNAMDLTSASPVERIRVFTRSVEHNAMIYGLFRREALVRTTYGHHFGHDYLVSLQACLLGPVEYVPSTLIRYHQRGDSLDTLMYPAESTTLKDLVLYRGVRRYKCWLTMTMGCWYLLRQSRPQLSIRIAATMAYAATFSRRHATRLATEALFIAFTPILVLMTPLRSTAVRVKDLLRRRGLVTP